MSRWMHNKDEFLNMARQNVLWPLSKVHRSKGFWEGGMVGSLELRMQGGKEQLLATDTAGSWQRKPRQRPRSRCLLLSVAITAASTAAWPPQGLQPCNKQKHTHTQWNILTRTSLLSCSGRHDRRRVQMRAQPLSQRHETSWPATDIHTLSQHTQTHTHTRALCGKGTKRDRENRMNRGESGKEDVDKLCQVRLMETAKETLSWRLSAVGINVQLSDVFLRQSCTQTWSKDKIPEEFRNNTTRIKVFGGEAKGKKRNLRLIVWPVFSLFGALTIVKSVSLHGSAVGHTNDLLEPQSLKSSWILWEKSCQACRARGREGPVGKSSNNLELIVIFNIVLYLSLLHCLDLETCIKGQCAT